MTALSDRLRERIDGAPRSRKLRASYRQRGVARSSEFRRIFSLPRRVWTEAQAEAVADLLTRELRATGGALPGGTLRLWPLQAIAIAEALEHGGALCPIPVGGGKALVSLLVPVLAGARRPLLLLPAHLREQTRARVIPEMRQHFRLRDDLLVVGYSELSLAKNATMLEDLAPDMIVMDEAHYLRERKSGRTRRATRYLRERPETRVVAMSGTITERSLRDYAHIARWTHGDARCPVPTRYTDVEEWADALDESVPDEQRVAPGALLDLCVDDETPREGFARRLVETPGVIRGEADAARCSLVLRRLDWPAPPAAAPYLRRLRERWEDPQSDVLAEAVAVWRLARWLALGYWLRWEPPAPRDWLDARRDWKQRVRHVLAHNRRGLDTELQVAREDASSASPSAEWLAWSSIRDTFKPHSTIAWLDDGIARRCADWLREEPRGICWAENPAFGREVARLAGVPFFGAGDETILECPGGPIVATYAHATGRNLQDRWSVNLVPSPPSGAKAWEQLLGRTHRAGQPEDEVRVDVVLSEPEQRESLAHAFSRARYVRETTRATQRLLLADRDFEVTP